MTPVRRTDLPSIDILDTGRLDERESAFPQAVQLPDGDIVCSYSNAGGQHATGGTSWSRSKDGGLTWQQEGVLLERSDDAPPAAEPDGARRESTLA